MHSDSLPPRSVRFVGLDWAFEEKKSQLRARSRKKARQERCQRKRQQRKMSKEQLQAKAFLGLALDKDNEISQQIRAMDSCQGFLQLAGSKGLFADIGTLTDHGKLFVCHTLFDAWKDDSEIFQKFSGWMNEAVALELYSLPKTPSPDKSSISSLEMDFLHVYSDDSASAKKGEKDDESGKGSHVSGVSVDLEEAQNFSTIIGFVGNNEVEKYLKELEFYASTTDGWKFSGRFIDAFLSEMQESEMNAATHGVVRDEMVEWFRQEDDLEKKFAFLREIFKYYASFLSSDSESHSTARSDPFAPPPGRTG